MKRLFEEKLIKWKNGKNRKPLMVIGVRQIGKTYTITEFCKQNFKEMIYLNIELDKWLQEIFEKTLKPKEIFELIELQINKKIDIENTVIFFDEVQVSERLIASLKYFCEADEEYNIICAGSLLGVKINRFESSFPVGKVQMEYMYPMSFEEFLVAIGEDMLKQKIENCYYNLEKMEEFLHEKLVKIYRTFLCVGGMPESVKEYISSGKDILIYRKRILQNIVEMYIADMNKYTFNKQESVKIEKLYKNIGPQLSNENLKFNYSNIEEHAKKSKYESSLDWLVASNLVLKCNDVKVPDVPINVYKEENIFKLYLSDVGILNSITEMNFSNILLNDNFRFKGAITENYIATEFKSKELNLYYWKSNRAAEIDFLLTDKNKIIPIEVKAAENTKSKSLKEYIEKYNPPYSIRISTKNFGFENNIKSIPLYATFCLAKDIKESNY